MFPEIYDLISYCLCEPSNGFAYGMGNKSWGSNDNAAVIGLRTMESIYCYLSHATICIAPISKTLFWEIVTAFHLSH